MKSCIRTRVGEKDISNLSLVSLIFLHKLEIISLETDSPSSFLIRFSRITLIELGILSGKLEDLIEKEEYTKFYMHRIGHWLGMDVHDVGNYKKKGKWRDLEPGMVLTIEPGVYILDSLKGVDKKWLGIGVRIEDDLLVTNDGNQVLTSHAPKEIQDIENLRS